MKIISKNFKLLTVFLLVIGFTACNDDDDSATPVATTTVVDVAIANGFTSLAEALVATDLVTTLEGTGPFTVFAPTNDAIDALLLSTGLNLEDLSPEEKTLLKNILLNHVIVGSALTAEAVIASAPNYLTTASPSGPNGTAISLFYNVNDGIVELNGGDGTTDAPRIGADVTMTDVTATNGIIHVINKVMLPPRIVDMAIANPNFSTLVQALTTLTPNTDFVATLSTIGAIPAPFTVFAPTNDAFDALTAIPAEDVLTQVLLYHVLGESNVQSGDLNQSGTTSPTTLQGQTIDIQLPGLGEGIIANVTDGAGNTDIGIIAVNVQTANGVIHVVNKVMLPSGD